MTNLFLPFLNQNNLSANSSLFPGHPEIKTKEVSDK
jgi:hypothetical protein